MHARSIVALAAVPFLVTPIALVLAAQSNQPANVPHVPLRVGLTIVTALNQPEQGDYESLKVIVQADAKQVQLKYSADVPEVAPPDDPLAGLFGGGKPQPAKKAAGGKKVVKRKPPERNFANWDLQTFKRLIGAPPERLTSRFQVSHGMLLNVLSRRGDGCRAMQHLIRESHEPDRAKAGSWKRRR